MVLLRCHHCEYKWDYGGKSKYYVTCPKCHFKVRIPEEETREIRRKQAIQSAVKRDQGRKLLGIAGIVQRTLEEYSYDKEMLIQVLLRLQNELGWLTRGMLLEVGKQLGVPLGRVFQVATFYKAFTLAPRGKNLIRVCNGTSCKVRGSPVIIDRVESILGIERGESTQDGLFSLETVNCVGCCALGPMMTVNGDYHGNLKLPDVEEVLSKYG